MCLSTVRMVGLGMFGLVHGLCWLVVVWPVFLASCVAVAAAVSVCGDRWLSCIRHI